MNGSIVKFTYFTAEALREYDDSSRGAAAPAAAVAEPVHFPGGAGDRRETRGAGFASLFAGDPFLSTLRLMVSPGFA